MKLLIASLLLLAGPMVGDGHEVGGAPEPPPEAEVFLTLYQGGGLQPYPVESRSVTIDTDGVVTGIVDLYYADGTMSSTTRVLATLSEDVTDGLIAETESVTGNLVDRQEGEPMCTDAPYTSFQANGVEFYRRANCHEYVDAGGAWTLTEVAKGLRALNWL